MTSDVHATSDLPVHSERVTRARTHRTADAESPAPTAVRRPAPLHLPATVAVRVTVAPPHWQRKYARAVVFTDLAAVATSAAGYRLWGSVPSFHDARILMGTGMVALAAGCLSATRAWETCVLGHGVEEFNRLWRAFLWLGALTALAGLALKAPALRPYAFGVVPIAMVLAFAARLSVRARIRALRRQGRCMRNVLVVGSEYTVARVVERTRRTRRTGRDGWAVTGLCLPESPLTPTSVAGVPVIGNLDQVFSCVVQFGYHAVCVAPDTGWSSSELHHLTWDLEGTGTEVVVDPGLMDIAGPRLQVHTVDGVPMLRLVEPTFRGVPKLLKALSDLLGATLLLILFAPLLLVTAVAVAADGGPVFYRQQRIGKNGVPFTMLKFRSMVTDADLLREALRDRNIAAGPMFKIRDDPRVTRVGRVLRRYSIDELPQLFNVLTGSMSLVGPRPPLLEESGGFDRAARRRLLVRPGMTGLWQVTGRSDLSWEETVRLDVSYVENWSLLNDALILLRTLAAVVHGPGAY